MSGSDRNQPCPCGSNKKYKHCCLSRDESVEKELMNLEEGITREEVLEVAEKLQTLTDGKTPEEAQKILDAYASGDLEV